MNGRKYEKLEKKELIRIAKIYGIKNRYKMKKDDLINAIKKAKRPLKNIKEIENIIRDKEKTSYQIPHVELLPKEPSYVFVNWDIPKEKNLTLKIIEEGKEFISLPVKESGKGYFRVPEGSNISASVGKYNGSKFKEIASSASIVMPVSTFQIGGETKWVNIKEMKIQKKKVNESKKMKEERKKIEELAKKIKYLRYPREK